MPGSPRDAWAPRHTAPLYPVLLPPHQVWKELPLSWAGSFRFFGLPACLQGKPMTGPHSPRGHLSGARLTHPYVCPFLFLPWFKFCGHGVEFQNCHFPRMLWPTSYRAVYTVILWCGFVVQVYLYIFCACVVLGTKPRVFLTHGR